MIISVVPYDPAWPIQFQAIKADLMEDLALYNAKYVAIEHVGSTSVPFLAAKPILDIAIVIASEKDFSQVKEALIWGDRQGGYQFIGNGGVRNRWSFKLYGILPRRSVYVVLKEGKVLRSYLDLRETLKRDAALRDEYARVKIGLASKEWRDVMEYAAGKDPIVAKILEKAGWTEAEIREKEDGAVKGWESPEREY